MNVLQGNSEERGHNTWNADRVLPESTYLQQEVMPLGIVSNVKQESTLTWRQRHRRATAWNVLAASILENWLQQHAHYVHLNKRSLSWEAFPWPTALAIALWEKSQALMEHVWHAREANSRPSRAAVHADCARKIHKVKVKPEVLLVSARLDSQESRESLKT